MNKQKLLQELVQKLSDKDSSLESKNNVLNNFLKQKKELDLLEHKKKILSYKYIPNVRFDLVHIHLNNEGMARRAVVHNDTFIQMYKNRWYQVNYYTGVRYPYVLTNTDLQADDWCIFFNVDYKIQLSNLKNFLLESKMKLEEE